MKDFQSAKERDEATKWLIHSLSLTLSHFLSLTLFLSHALSLSLSLSLL
jgi:hypothetical protein